jgi:hypothetical protein
MYRMTCLTIIISHKLASCSAKPLVGIPEPKKTLLASISQNERARGGGGVFMLSTLNSGEFLKHFNTFSRHLKGISESDIAKAEFLPLTLLLSITHLSKILHKEKYNYGDIVRSFKLYVPGRQKNI